MITINAKDTNSAWVEVLKKITLSESVPNNPKFLKAERIVIEIKNSNIVSAHKSYPKTQEELNIINEYLISGNNEDNMWHRWTKIYRHRLFDNPNSQIEYIIKRLKKKENAIACTWEKEIDQDTEIMPCMLTIWCGIREGKLDLHLHGQEGDLYKKSIMNMQEFITLQKYISEELNIEIGRFIFSLDFGYIFVKDMEDILKVLEDI